LDGEGIVDGWLWQGLVMDWHGFLGSWLVQREGEAGVLGGGSTLVDWIAWGLVFESSFLALVLLVCLVGIAFSSGLLALFSWVFLGLVLSAWFGPSSLCPLLWFLSCSSVSLRSRLRPSSLFFLGVALACLLSGLSLSSDFDRFAWLSVLPLGALPLWLVLLVSFLSWGLGVLPCPSPRGASFSWSVLGVTGSEAGVFWKEAWNGECVSCVFLSSRAWLSCSWVCASLAWQWRFSCVVLFLFVPWCFRLDCVAFGLWMYSFPGYLVVFRPSSASGFGVSSGAFSCVPLLVPGCTYFPGWCFAWQALDSLGLGGLVLVGVE
jgi:hypothetical protein